MSENIDTELNDQVNTWCGYRFGTDAANKHWHKFNIERGRSIGSWDGMDQYNSDALIVAAQVLGESFFRYIYVGGEVKI